MHLPRERRKGTLQVSQNAQPTMASCRHTVVVDKPQTSKSHWASSFQALATPKAIKNLITIL
jgi:hypothetical protein